MHGISRYPQHTENDAELERSPIVRLDEGEQAGTIWQSSAGTTSRLHPGCSLERTTQNIQDPAANDLLNG